MRGARRGSRRDRRLFLGLVVLCGPLALLICALSGLFARPDGRWLYRFKTVSINPARGWMAAEFEGQHGDPATEYRTYAALRSQPDSDSLDPNKVICAFKGRHALRLVWEGDRRLTILCPDCTDADVLRKDDRWRDGPGRAVRLVYALASGPAPRAPEEAAREAR